MKYLQNNNLKVERCESIVWEYKQIYTANTNLLAIVKINKINAPVVHETCQKIKI